MNSLRLLPLFCSLLIPTILPAAELLIGSATVDITPDQPVALAGQFNTRISKQPETPIEALDSGARRDLAIMIPCDLVAIRRGIQENLLEKLTSALLGMGGRNGFLDYGVQMKSRSPAEQTFLIQLATDSGRYLPTQKAIEGGSYSALPVSNRVGPEGGRVLVNETVEAIRKLWPAP